MQSLCNCLNTHSEIQKLVETASLSYGNMMVTHGSLLIKYGFVAYILPQRLL